jgi:restriction system protein
MAVWLVRAGSHGEYERKFLDDKRIYVCWDELNKNLGDMTQRQELIETLAAIHPQGKLNTLRNWASQIWPFAHSMVPGDLVVLPSKVQPAIYVGQITGDYQYEPKGPDPYFHWRSVNWHAEPVPRSHFGQDLLYSFGAFMTICRIQRNNAESRLLAMKQAGWKPESVSGITSVTPTEADDTEQVDTDLVTLAQDQISKFIAARFKGHDLTRLVEGILKAQGYTTFRSPEGPDGGVDILAGVGPLGFGQPRLCVQVKSQDTPVEARSVTELRGAMQNVNATEGLFVAWGGYKSSVYRQTAANFFSIRLWTQKELIETLLETYQALDDELKAELPLKRVWTIASSEI